MKLRKNFLIFSSLCAIAWTSSAIAHEQKPMRVGEIAQMDLNHIELPDEENKKPEIDPLLIKKIKNTVNLELNAIAHGNLSEAYQFTSKSFRNKTSLKAFSDFVLSYREYWNRVSFKWDEIIFYSDGVAKLRGTMPVMQEKYQVIYFLTPEGDTWRILGMQVLPPAPF